MRLQDIEIRPDNPQADSKLAAMHLQHLCSSISVELTQNPHDKNTETLFAELPYEQFMQLRLQKGANVAVKVRNARCYT